MQNIINNKATNFSHKVQVLHTLITRRWATHFIEQVDLGILAAVVTGMPQKKLNETHECIQRMETLCSDPRHHGIRIFRQRSVAQVDAHLRTEAEKSCDQIISFQYAL